MIVDNIVITGGAGMVGSNLVRRLKQEGVKNIKVIDNLWRHGSWDNLKENGEFIIPESNCINLDLSSYDNAVSAVNGAEVVIHLADIVAGIGFVFNNQSNLFEKNCQINMNIFRACKEMGVKKVLYVGSVCSHPAEKQNSPDSPALKDDEVWTGLPESSYGLSKLIGEYHLELIAREDSKIEVAILRFHNLYGPYCSTNPKTSQVIPAIIRNVIEAQDELVVWGSGSQTRDFVYVDDAVNSIVLALEKGWNKQPIQIGTGKATSIKEIAETVVKISGKPIKIKYDLSKKEGDRGRHADYSRAKDILGWEPKVGLEEGLRKTYDWINRKYS